MTGDRRGRGGNRRPYKLFWSGELCLRRNTFLSVSLADLVTFHAKRCLICTVGVLRLCPRVWNDTCGLQCIWCCYLLSHVVSWISLLLVFEENLIKWVRKRKLVISFHLLDEVFLSVFLCYNAHRASSFVCYNAPELCVLTRALCVTTHSSFVCYNALELYAFQRTQD